MQRFSMLVLLAFASTLPVDVSVGQQASLRDQLIGSWSYVSIYDLYEDGKKAQTFGSSVKGVITYGSDGRFSQILIGEPRSELKTADPRRPDAFLVTFYGTYTVNEGDKSVSHRIEGAGYSSRVGSEFKNSITIRGDTLTYVGGSRKDQIGSFSPHGELKRLK